MHTDQSAHERKYEQPFDPPWLPMYRNYLYFGMILSAVGLLLSFTIYAGGSIVYAFLSTAIAAIAVGSLKRFGERPITILHLAVNGITLIAAIMPVSNYGYGLPKLLALAAVDYKVLQGLIGLLFGYSFSTIHQWVAGAVTLSFSLLSIFWLKNLYPYLLSHDGDQPYGDHVTHDRDGESASSELGGKFWYVSKPLLGSALIAGAVILLIMAASAEIGLPWLSLFFGVTVGGIIVLIGGVVSVYRMFKAVK